MRLLLFLFISIFLFSTAARAQANFDQGIFKYKKSKKKRKLKKLTEVEILLMEPIDGQHVFKGKVQHLSKDSIGVMDAEYNQFAMKDVSCIKWKNTSKFRFLRMALVLLVFGSICLMIGFLMLFSGGAAAEPLTYLGLTIAFIALGMFVGAGSSPSVIEIDFPSINWEVSILQQV